MNIKFPLTDQMKRIRSIEKTMEDALKLADCINTWSDDDSWGGSFGSAKYTPQRVFEDWLINSRQAFQLVLDEGGSIHGYCSIDIHWEDEDAMYIGLLGVSPKEQKKGFGKALLLESLKKTIESGKKRLDLHTWAGNERSIPLYKKTGYMWRPDTSVLMENYLPAILSTSFFESFFRENEFYLSRILEITQEQDSFVHLTMDAYQYTFEKDKQNSLKVFIDRHAKEISGFILIKEGQKLSIQLKPSQHNIYLGLDSPTAELEIINETEETVNISGVSTWESGILSMTPSNIDIVVPPGEIKTLNIELEINLEVDAYNPKQDTHNRTKSRFLTTLQINGLQCALGVGFVPEDAIAISMSKSTAYFGKLTKSVKIPVGISNNTNETLKGNITIKGEGLDDIHTETYLLDPNGSSEIVVEMLRPKTQLVKACEWQIATTVKKEEETKHLPNQSLFVSCFTKPGVVAYNDYKRKLSVIENEQLKFAFMMKSEKLITKLAVASIDQKIEFYAYSMDIGKPYPSRGSELWIPEKSFEIIETENGISLKQTFLSKTEKPGLQITRWVELEAGKPFLSTYFDMKNTNKAEDSLIIRNICIKNGIWGTPNNMKGPLIIPLKDEFLVLEEPALNDPYDFPMDVNQFNEPWIARESCNEQGVGFGLIWNPPEVDKIKYTMNHWGPAIETKPFDLNPQETKRIGHLSLVVGQHASQLTRRVWLKELDGKSEIKQGSYRKGTSIVDVCSGQKFIHPRTESFSIPNISFYSKEEKMIPVTIKNMIEQKNPINFILKVKSDILKQEKEIKDQFKNKENINLQISKEDLLDEEITSLFGYKSKLSFLDFQRDYQGLCIPFSSQKKVSIEQHENEWILSNGYLTFKTSPSHGASIYSLMIDKKEFFLTKYPSKKAFVWFKRFLGGLHPHLRYFNNWDYADFYKNIWTKPKLIEKEGWTGVQLSLESSFYDNRLKNISLIVTYYTKAEAPFLLVNLQVKNNSNKTIKIETGLSLFTKQVEQLLVPRNNSYLKGNYSKHRRVINTKPPDNWVIADYGDEIPKMLIIAPEPNAMISTNHANANNYSNFNCNNKLTFAPNEIFEKNLLLIFSNDLDLLKTYNLRESIVKL